MRGSSRVASEVACGGQKLTPFALEFLLIQAARRGKYVVIQIDGKDYELRVVPAQERSNG